ncbi:MAG: V-type ATP synthase subunit A, partial [Spirochaetes bacterium]
MADRVIGKIKKINGPVIEAMGVKDARMFELVRVSDENVVGEVVKLEGDTAIIQVYEDTTGIAPEDPIYGSGIPLSVELGPGLIGNIYDGIQRPLERIREMTGIYIKRGIMLDSIDKEKKWHFIPIVTEGEEIYEGMVVGTVKETERIEHRVLVPLGINGKIKSIVS